MYKKPIIACMALAAFVASAIVPSIASAKPELTHPTGTTLSVGSKIKGTNVGTSTFTSSLGNFHCDHSSMTGEVTANTGTLIEMKITGASFNGPEAGTDCESFGGAAKVTPVVSAAAPWCIKANDSTKDVFTFQACPGPFIFIYEFTNGLTCSYGKSTAGQGTFATDITGQDAILTLSGQGFPKESGGFLCPAEVKADWSFTFETDSVTPEPLYIS